jgi:hypothetical protein
MFRYTSELFANTLGERGIEVDVQIVGEALSLASEVFLRGDVPIPW